jgi:hypothetical protein
MSAQAQQQTDTARSAVQLMEDAGIDLKKADIIDGQGQIIRAGHPAGMDLGNEVDALPGKRPPPPRAPSREEPTP